jgi:Protein of unknown function (DUF1631)
MAYISCNFYENSGCMNPTSSHSATDGTAHSSGIFAQCMRQATALARAMMGELLLKADTLIRARQTAETELPARMALGEAADTLARHKDLLMERFPDVLDKAMAQAMRSGPATAVKPTAAAPLRFDQLELMDDAQVQGRIDTARMQQSATQGCERELGELDALVCAARGFANVQLDRNPFRPQIVGAALMEVLTMVPSTPAQRAVWMQSLGASLGEQLRRLYQQLADFLRKQQVQSATYAMTGGMGGSGGGGSGGGGSGGGGSGGGGVSAGHAAAPGQNVPSAGQRSARVDSSRLTVNQLRQVLGADYFQQGSQADEVEQDLEALGALVQQLRSGSYQLDQVSKTSSQGEDSELHTSRANALSVYETPADEKVAVVDKAVAQDVVRMMVDNLCDDQRLLQSVRDWVGSLEPPLLALVAVDVGFLSDKRHPARLLLDEVTARSLGFANEAAEGFTDFFDPVLAASAKLQPHAMPDAQPFELAWQAIELAWSKQKSAAQMQSEQAMQALLQAEQRNLLADKIALELTRRDDARLAPIFVKQFIAGPWAQVLAQTRLNPALRQAAQDYLDAVAELLWSVVPEQASRNKPRLVRLIPKLLASIREGLAMVGSPVHEGDAFFSQLMQVHEAALKAGLPPRVAAKPKAQEDRPQVPEQPIRADDAVWLAPQEERDSGFLDDRESAPQSTLPMQYDDEAAQTAPAAIDEIGGLLIMEPPELGSWVEFLSNERWVRAQLTWASPHGTLFMFTGAAGNPTSMTRRALDKMQAKQTLRIITQDSVVVGALNAVAQTAMRNTINPVAV